MGIRVSRLAANPLPVVCELSAAVASAPIVLAVLSLFTPVGLVSALTALGVTLAVVALLARAAPPAGLGPANRVTLARAVLVAVVAGLVAESGAAAAGLTDVRVSELAGGSWPVAVLSATALLLDGVDGAVARRFQSVTRLGARFDMEVDALLLLVLSGAVLPRLGTWVLAIGLMRYAFLAAGWVLPRLRGVLPPSTPRRVVAVVQGVALAAATAPATPDLAGGVLAAVALVLLTGSFGRDVARLLG